MRFKTNVRNISTFTKLTQSLSSIGKIAWLRLCEDEVRFVLHAPEGTQVWANLTIQTLFDTYLITSAANNVINLEVPLPPLHRALRSCALASSATLRLTKRASDNAPVLCLTITSSSSSSSTALITQEIPVRVLSAASVESIHEPRVPPADVHIYLPGPLGALRAVVDRLNRLAGETPGMLASTSGLTKISVAANMEGGFKMGIVGGEVKVETCWRDLQNPRLVVEDGDEEGGASTAVATVRDKAKWAEVRIDGREWARVLKVGGLARRVVACVCEGVALVVYVFLTEEQDLDQTVLTYYMNSYSA